MMGPRFFFSSVGHGESNSVSLRCKHRPHMSRTAVPLKTPAQSTQLLSKRGSSGLMHTPQSSMIKPENGTPSHPAQVELSPKQIPQASGGLGPLGIPLQSVQLVSRVGSLGARHKPHSSTVKSPLGTPAQSEHDWLKPGALGNRHTPHASNSRPPLGTSAQSRQLVPSPSQTPQTSSSAGPKQKPRQSRSVGRQHTSLGSNTSPTWHSTYTNSELRWGGGGTRERGKQKDSP